MMLGRLEMPAFVHHPLIRHASGVKLSKARAPELAALFDRDQDL